MKKFGIIFILMLTFGCVKEVDFDQVDDIEIRSKYIASLSYFDLLANDFLDENQNELSMVEDVIMPNISSDSHENVERLDFTFEISNSFARDFITTVIFYDSDGNEVYSFEPITVPANSSEVQTVITVLPPDIETIYGAHMAGFHITLVADPNDSLDPDTPGVLNVKSSLTLFLNVKP